MPDELPAYWAMAETYLWPAKDRRVPWRDLVMRAKTDPTWPWMPGARGLDLLRDEALKQGRWRQTPGGPHREGALPGREDLGERHPPGDQPRDRRDEPVAHPPQRRRQPPRLRRQDRRGVGSGPPGPGPGGLPHQRGDPVLHRGRQRRQVPDRRADPLDRGSRPSATRSTRSPTPARSSCAAPRRRRCATPWTAPTPRRGPSTPSPSRCRPRAAPS